MDLIIGTHHITPDAITRTGARVETVLHGDALMSLLNAASQGTGTIEILAGDLTATRWR